MLALTPLVIAILPLTSVINGRAGLWSTFPGNSVEQSIGDDATSLEVLHQPRPLSSVTSGSTSSLKARTEKRSKESFRSEDTNCGVVKYRDYEYDSTEEIQDLYKSQPVQVNDTSCQPLTVEKLGALNALSDTGLSNRYQEFVQEWVVRQPTRAQAKKFWQPRRLKVIRNLTPLPPDNNPPPMEYVVDYVLPPSLVLKFIDVDVRWAAAHTTWISGNEQFNALQSNSLPFHDLLKINENETSTVSEQLREVLNDEKQNARGTDNRLLYFYSTAMGNRGRWPPPMTSNELKYLRQYLSMNKAKYNKVVEGVKIILLTNYPHDKFLAQDWTKLASTAWTLSQQRVKDLSKADDSYLLSAWEQPFPHDDGKTARSGGFTRVSKPGITCQDNTRHNWFAGTI